MRNFPSGPQQIVTSIGGHTMSHPHPICCNLKVPSKYSQWTCIASSLSKFLLLEFEGLYGVIPAVMSLFLFILFANSGQVELFSVACRQS